MITVFTIHFQLAEGQFIRGFNGRIVHGAFLQYIRKNNIELSAELHDGNAKRPYTLSPMVFQKNGEKWQGSFDINTTNEKLIHSILSLITTNNHTEIYIVDELCKVIGIEFKQYKIPDPVVINKEYKFQMNFLTPCYFSNDKRKSKNDPYPNLHRIWRDCVNSYTQFVHLSKENREELLTKLSDQIRTPYFSFHSVPVSLGKHMKLVGFKGKISFVVEDPKGLEHLPGILKAIEIWGVGGKKSMAFGRVEMMYLKDLKKLKHGGNGIEREVKKASN